MLVIVLLTPLQAAGEEYAFRGYLTQAFGGLFRRRVRRPPPRHPRACCSRFAHGAQDAPIFVDRFAFGLVAGILVIATGGLEAGHRHARAQQLPGVRRSRWRSAT